MNDAPAISPASSGQEAFSSAAQSQGVMGGSQPQAMDLSSLMQSSRDSFSGNTFGLDENAIVKGRIDSSKPYWAQMKDPAGKSVYEHYMDSNPNDGQPQEQGGGIGLPSWVRVPEAEKDMSESTYTTDIVGQGEKIGMNALKTAWNLPAGIINSILHPYDTFKGIATLGLGIGDMAFNPKSDQAEMARQFLSKHLYGIGVDNVGEVLSKVIDQAKNDPAQLALNISGLLKSVSVAGKMGEAGKLGSIGSRAAMSDAGQMVRGVADKYSKPFDAAMEYTNPAALLSMGGKGAARLTGMSKADVNKFATTDIYKPSAINQGISEGGEFGQSASLLKNAGAESEFIQGAKKDVEGISGNTSTREGVQEIYKSHQNDTTPVGDSVVNDVRGGILDALEKRDFKLNVDQNGQYTATPLRRDIPSSEIDDAQKIAKFMQDQFEPVAKEGMTIGTLARYHDKLNKFLETPPGVDNHFAGGVRDALTSTFMKSDKLGAIRESAQAANLRRTVFGENGTPESAAAQFTQGYVKGGKKAEEAASTIRDLAKFAKNEPAGEALIQKLDDYATGFRNSKVSGAGAGFFSGAAASAIGGHIVGPLVGAVIMAAKSPKLMARLVQITSIPQRALSKLGEYLSAKLYGTGNPGAAPEASVKPTTGTVPPEGGTGPSAGPTVAPEAQMAPVAPAMATKAPETTTVKPTRHTLEEEPVETPEMKAAAKQKEAEMDAWIAKREAEEAVKQPIAKQKKELRPDKAEIDKLSTDQRLAKLRKAAGKNDKGEVDAEPAEPKSAPVAKKSAPVKKVAPAKKESAPVKKEAPDKKEAPAKKEKQIESDKKPLNKMGAAELKKTLKKMSVKELNSEMQKIPGVSDLSTAIKKEFNSRQR